MHAGADTDPAGSQRGYQFQGAAGCSCWPVEDGEYAVTRVLLALSVIFRQNAVHQAVVCIELMAPPRVALLGESFGRPDDVGEQHGRQQSLASHRTGLVTDEIQESRAQRVIEVGMRSRRQFDELRPGNSRRSLLCSLERDHLVLATVQNKSRGADRRKHWLHVGLEKGLPQERRHRRARTHALETAHHLADSGDARRLAEELVGQGSIAPMLIDLVEYRVVPFPGQAPLREFVVPTCGRPVKHKCPNAIGVGRGEQQAHGPTLRHTEQGWALSACGIHHRA